MKMNFKKWHFVSLVILLGIVVINGQDVQSPNMNKEKITTKKWLYFNGLDQHTQDIIAYTIRCSYYTFILQNPSIATDCPEFTSEFNKHCDRIEKEFKDTQFGISCSLIDVNNVKMLTKCKKGPAVISFRNKKNTIFEISILEGYLGIKDGSVFIKNNSKIIINKVKYIYLNKSWTKQG